MEHTHEHGGKSSESLMDKAAILKTLDVASGQTVLDAGCGGGYMAKAFAERVGPTGKVYAMDIHEPSIRSLSGEMRDRMNMVVRQADITEDTGVPASSVDLLYLSTVMHGFGSDQRKGFLREADRIVKPGGVLAIVEINKMGTPFGPPMAIRLSPQELIDAVGWTAKTCVRVGEYFYMQTFEKR